MDAALAVSGPNIVEDASEHLNQLRQLYDEQRYEETVEKFHKLHAYGVVPNKYAYLWVLTANSHLGRSRDSMSLLQKMKVRCIGNYVVGFALI